MGQSLRIKFGKRIRTLREKSGLTQQKLAELADLDYKHVQRIESKNPTDVKLETVEKLAKG
jgi:transcriptional regulator with XRE-family HTH domain